MLTLQAEELSQSLDERKRQAEDQQRAQAGKVTAWFGMQTYDSFSTVGPGPPSQQWGAFIRNASDLPILDVQVFFNFIAEAQPGGGWTPVPRGAAEKIHVLPPQANRFVEIPRDVKSKHDQCDDQVYAVSIEFTDNVGVRWVRDARGALKRG